MAVQTMRLGMTARERGGARLFWRFRRNKLVLVGGALVTLVILAAIFAPLLSPFSPYEQHNA